MLPKCIRNTHLVKTVLTFWKVSLHLCKSSNEIVLKLKSYHVMYLVVISWINVVMIMFHKSTGINVVLMYFKTILETILGSYMVTGMSIIMSSFN